ARTSNAVSAFSPRENRLNEGRGVVEAVVMGARDPGERHSSRRHHPSRLKLIATAWPRWSAPEGGQLRELYERPPVPDRLCAGWRTTRRTSCTPGDPSIAGP